jgi:hypothetical protein
MSDCTVFGNQAGIGGGVYANIGDMTLTNTIVAGNTLNSTFGHDPNFSGTLTAGSGHNILKGSAGLGPLADYGGPTYTLPLGPGSRAVGTGGALIRLTSAVDATATSIPVDDTGPAGIPGTVIRVGDELMQVTGTTVAALTVVRSFGGTTAAAHAVNALGYPAYDQRGAVRAVPPDIGAFQHGVGAASRLAVTAPAAATTGQSFKLVVRAVAGQNGTATGYRGTVHFISSVAGSSLPGDYTFTAADHGMHTFFVSVPGPGLARFSAADTTKPWLSADAPVTINTAPALAAGSPILTPVAVNDQNPAGDTVGSFAGPLIDDPDPGAARGIAVVGVGGTRNGTWQFWNGNAWIGFGSRDSTFGRVSSHRALLLDATDHIRFVPVPGYTLTVATAAHPSISYRAWDETGPTAGHSEQAFRITATGGASPFSAGKQSATVIVNSAPVLTAIGPQLGPVPSTSDFTITVAALVGTSIQDTNTGTLQGIAVTGLTTTAGGSWQFSIDGAHFQDFAATDSSAVLLRSTDRLRYVPAAGSGGTATITYRAWDQTTDRPGDTIDLSGGSAVGGTTAFSSATDTGSLTVT